MAGKTAPAADGKQAENLARKVAEKATENGNGVQTSNAKATDNKEASRGVKGGSAKGKDAPKNGKVSGGGASMWAGAVAVIAVAALVAALLNDPSLHHLAEIAEKYSPPAARLLEQWGIGVSKSDETLLDTAAETPTESEFASEVSQSQAEANSEASSEGSQAEANCEAPPSDVSEAKAPLIKPTPTDAAEDVSPLSHSPQRLLILRKLRPEMAISRNGRKKQKKRDKRKKFFPPIPSCLGPGPSQCWPVVRLLLAPAPLGSPRVFRSSIVQFFA